MKKKLSEGRENKRKALLRKRKEEPAAFWTYVVLRFIVILILIRCILRGDIESAFVCVLVLVIYLLPQFVENKLNIDIPTALEVIIFVFVFAAEILGELQSYFIKYSNWDTILHTTGMEPPKATRVLELNGEHPAFKALEVAVATDPERAKKLVNILHSQALLIAGEELDDPSAYAEDVCSLF